MRSVFAVFLSFAAKRAVYRVKELRLHREDFETLKIIGRGAFGEASSFNQSFNNGGGGSTSIGVFFKTV